MKCGRTWEASTIFTVREKEDSSLEAISSTVFMDSYLTMTMRPERKYTPSSATLIEPLFS